jgi:hypothetical protein
LLILRFNALVRLFSDNVSKISGAASKRNRSLQAILAIANGDIGLPRIVHFCRGATCCQAGKDEAVYKLVQALLERFGGGFSVPLLYRWKHAEVSLRFFRDGFLLFGILQKTMDRMKATRSSIHEDILNDMLAAAAHLLQAPGQQDAAMLQARP